ncbi:hypothetical protein KJ660_01025 [Candidatus Micrarchaeota archaeon]|nr:hypothetical protein [Candidatus Micrarchaeota archaeon]
MERGIASIDSMIAFTVFISVIGLFASGLMEQGEKIGELGDSIKAETDALNCSLLVNSIYANSGGKLNEVKVNCFVEENEVKSKVKEKTFEAFVIPSELSLEEGKETKLKVEVNEHYRKKNE